jgi:hypothetical protein
VRGAQISNAFGIDNNERRLPFGIFDQVKDRILFSGLDNFKIASPPYPGWSIWLWERWDRRQSQSPERLLPAQPQE